MITATATVGGSIGVTAQLMSVQTTVCAAVTEQVNDVTVGTTPSGGVNNQLNQDTAGNQVGTGANPSVVANSTAVNSDGSYSLSILAEGSNVISNTPILANGALVISQPSTIAKDVVVRYANGTLVGAVVGSEIEIPNPVAAPTLTIGVFNSLGDPVETADFGEVLTIDLTTSIAATEFRFLIFQNGLQGVATIQAGNTLLYTVDSFTDIMIYAEAKDATSVAAALVSFNVAVAGIFPPDISGCVLWVNAAIAATYTLNGSSISQMDDLSGNSNHIVAPAISNEPSFLDTGFGINGLRSAKYLSGDYLLGSGLSLDTVTGSSVYIVCRFNTSVTAGIISNGNNEIDGTAYLFIQQNGLFLRTYQQGAPSGSYSANTPIVLGTNYLVELHRTTTSEVLIINGTTIHTRAINTSGNKNNIYVNSGFGGQSTATIADIDIHNGVLSALNKETIRDYLMSKWGI